MSIRIDDNDGRLSPIADLLEIAAHDAVARIDKTLPAEEIDIEFAYSKWVIPHLGHTGRSPNGTTILVNVDPDNQNLLPNLQQSLPRVLAHEVHHCHRHLGPGYGTSLDQAIVTEGLADHFMLEVFGGAPDAWSVALKAGALKRWLGEARNEFGIEGYNHDEWFFGHGGTRGIPRWAGYSLGFYLVGRYLAARPSAKPSALVNVAADTILAATIK